MFCISGIAPEISVDLFPPLDISDSLYEIGLVDLTTYFTIPNIEKGVNDEFHYGDGGLITIDEGSYEVENIESFIVAKLSKDVQFSLKANNNTLKAEILCTKEIHFDRENSVGSLLGFSKRVLEPNTVHVSDKPVNIMNVNVIRVECNIARGSYYNGSEGHIIHEFYPNIPPGYKIVEIPSTVIYLPVNINRVNNITVCLRDQNGKLVNFRNEPLSLRLHIRKRNGFGI